MFTDSDTLLPDKYIEDKYVFLKSEPINSVFYKNTFLFKVSGNIKFIKDLKIYRTTYKNNIYIDFVGYDVNAHISNIYVFNNDKMNDVVLELYVKCSLKQFEKIEKFLASEKSTIGKSYGYAWNICSTDYQ